MRGHLVRRKEEGERESGQSVADDDDGQKRRRRATAESVGGSGSGESEKFFQMKFHGGLPGATKMGERGENTEFRA